MVTVNSNYLQLGKNSLFIKLFTFPNNYLRLVKLFTVNNNCFPLIEIFTVNNNYLLLIKYLPVIKLFTVDT